jgi:iron(III) transport system substrate-binding protein
MKRFRPIRACFLLIAATLTQGAVFCVQAAQAVVVYTSIDQEYAEVVFKEAAQATGLQIQPVFDAEASKTVGLERRLVAEKAQPKADVFSNSEFLRTHRLSRQGVLAPTAVDKSLALPADVITPNSVGFGIRARVIVAHAPSVPPADRPQTLEALADPRFKGKVAIARPLFGTTSTHFAALHAQWGEDRFVRFLQALKANQVTILPGNGDVRDAVVAGRAAVGLTDTDDALGALRRGQPLAMVFPDQDTAGAFGVYMTVAKVAGGPNPAGAQKLVDYLASEKAEARLIELGAVQIPVRPHLPMAKELGAVRPKLWFMDPTRIEGSLQPSVELIRKHLL